MVDSKHPWKAWIYLLPAIILLLVFTVWPIFNTVTTAFIYNEKFLPGEIQVEKNVTEDGEETYRFFYADATSAKHYVSAIVSDDKSVHLGYVDSPNDEKSVFRYDTDFGAWVVKANEKQYFIGATKDSDAKLFELTEANKDLINKKQIFPAALLKKDGKTSVTTDIDVSEAYNFGVFKGAPEALRYVLDSGENGALNTTNEYAQSVNLWPTSNTKGFSFYIGESGKPQRYMDVVVDENGGASLEYIENQGLRKLYIIVDGVRQYITVYNDENGEVAVKFDKNGSSVYSYDTEKNVWVTDFEGTEYYLGSDSGFNAIGVYELSELNADDIGTSQFVAGFGKPSKVSESPIPAEVTEPLLNEKGYKFFLGDKTADKAVYLTGDVDGNKLAVSDKNDDAIDIYSESADAVFFTYDNSAKAWVCDVDGVTYYLGLNVEDLLCVHALSEIDAEMAPAPAVFYRQLSTVGEAVEIQAADISEDDAYHIGSFRAAEGTQTYITTGASLTEGLMLTDDKIAGESFSRFGLNNFITVLTDRGSDFLICLRNTFLLTVVTVPISTILALLIAVALNSIKPLQRMLQTIFFLPYVTNSIAIGMVFAAMFNIVGLNSTQESIGMINIIINGCVSACDAVINPFIYVINLIVSVFDTAIPYNVAADIGNVIVNVFIFIVNCILGAYNFIIGILPDFFEPLCFDLIDYNILGSRINWINSGAPEWATFATLIVYIVWNALPFKILILLGGLQSINKQYYDAAKIDSTPKWRVLTKITVPLLSPMLTYTIITSFIGGFKEYSSVIGILGDNRSVIGGANMNTIVGHIQNHLDAGQSNYGLAGAAALMLFAIIFVVTMINLRISKKNTHY